MAPVLKNHNTLHCSRLRQDLLALLYLLLLLLLGDINTIFESFNFGFARYHYCRYWGHSLEVERWGPTTVGAV